jgi:hypothetical protein
MSQRWSGFEEPAKAGFVAVGAVLTARSTQLFVKPLTGFRLPFSPQATKYTQMSPELVTIPQKWPQIS